LLLYKEKARQEMIRSNAANPKKSTVIAEILFGNSEGKLSAIPIIRTNMIWK